MKRKPSKQSRENLLVSWWSLRRRWKWLSNMIWKFRNECLWRKVLDFQFKKIGTFKYFSACFFFFFNPVIQICCSLSALGFRKICSSRLFCDVSMVFWTQSGSLAAQWRDTWQKIIFEMQRHRKIQSWHLLSEYSGLQIVS